MSTSDPNTLAVATTLEVHQGLVALEGGDATTALTHFEQALGLDPDSAVAAWQRAVALARLGRADDALGAARRALASHPEHAQLRALVARLERAAGAQPSSPPPSVPPPEATAWAIGETIDARWEVFGSARGGMGRVYFVRDHAWGGLELAVKTLSTAADTPMNEVSRVRALFRRETQVWLDLGAHPHIVSGFYTLELGSALRFFMEYVPGHALDVLLRAGRPTRERALDLAIQLAAGIEYVHARGAVHRDLKSGNCLVTDDGTLRLTDFGLGKLAVEGDAAHAISASSAATAHFGVSLVGAGTPWYMAPEQWRSLGEAGPAADVYALGVVLYELLAGCYPFDAGADALARHRGRIPPRLERLVSGATVSRELVLWLLHTEVAPPPLRELCADTPPGLEALALQCLAKSPVDRPSAHDVRVRLLAQHREWTGREYARELPGGLEPTEAGENNRAVSYFVMGEADRARAILDHWLDAHPTATYPWINRHTIDLALGEAEPARVAVAFHRSLSAAHGLAKLEADAAVLGFARHLARHAPWTLGPVAAAAFARDGASALLAAGSSAVLVRASDGAALRALKGHEAAICSVALDARGERALTGSFDKTARLFDLRTGTTLRVFEGHREAVTSVAFAPDGARVITGGGASHGRADRTARVWNASTGRLLHTLRGHRGAITSVTFSPDGSRLALGSADGSASLWDGATAEQLWTFEPDAQRSPTVRVGFTPDGARLYQAQRDGTVSLWATDSGRLVRAIGTRATCTGADLSADGTRLAVAGEAGEVVVFRTADGERVWSVVASIGRVECTVFAPDGERLLVAGEAGAEFRALGASAVAVREPWPMLVHRPTSAHGLLQRARELDALERRAASGERDSFPELDALRDRTNEHQRDEALALRIDLAARRAGGRRTGLRDAWTTHRVELGPGLQGVAFAPDARGDVLLGASNSAGIAVHRWHPATGRTEPAFAALPAGTSTVTFAPHGRLAIAGGRNGALALCRVPSGKVALQLAEPGGPRVSTVAFAPDGRVALSGSEDGTIRLWRVDDGVLLRTLRGHRLEVTSAVFTRDGRHVLTGSWDGTARLQDATTGATVRAFEGHAGGVSAVALLPDEARAVTASEDGTARIWSLGTGQPEATLEGHSAGLTSVAVSADGSLVLSGSWDGAARIFSTEDGQNVRALEGHGYGVTSVAFGDDDAHALTGSMDGTARLWMLDGRWTFDR